MASMPFMSAAPRPEPRSVVLEGNGRDGHLCLVYNGMNEIYFGSPIAYRPTGRVDAKGREVWSCEADRINFQADPRNGPDPQSEPEPEPQSWRDRKPLL